MEGGKGGREGGRESSYEVIVLYVLSPGANLSKQRQKMIAFLRHHSCLAYLHNLRIPAEWECKLRLENYLRVLMSGLRNELN